MDAGTQTNGHITDTTGLIPPSSQTKSTLSASKILDGAEGHIERLGMQQLLAFMKGTEPSSPTAYNLCRIIEEMMDDDIEGFPANPPKKTSKDAGEDEYDSKYPQNKLPQHNKVDIKDWQRIQEFFQEKHDEIPDDGEPTVLTNLARLSKHLKLTEEETKTLKLLYVMEYGFVAHHIMEQLIDSDAKLGPTIARILEDEKRHTTYTRAISTRGKLSSFDIIRIGGSGETRFPVISIETEELLETPELSADEIKKAMVGNPTETELTYEDFKYLGPDLDTAIEIVRNAARNGTLGVNISLDGPTGGGKTELAKVILSEAGLTGYSVGESEELTSNSVSKQITTENLGSNHATAYTSLDIDMRDESAKRFSEMVRAEAVLADDDEAGLVFDEIEDLLIKGGDSSKAADTSSKIALNTFMLNNKKPTIYCGNDTQKFDQSYRNRFIFSLYIDHPPVRIRQKIWQRQLELQGVKLDDQTVMNFARKYDASPRQITYAIKAASLSSDTIRTIETVLPASARITNGSRSHILDRGATSELYSPLLSNMKAKSGSLPSQLIEKAQKHVPFSLLVKGPLGSGLQSFTRHLAEGMLRNPQEESAIELTTPSERETPAEKIYKAFGVAANLRRFLVVHDIENLSEKPDDQASWINAPLPQFFVELARKHPLPFAVTTSRANSNDILPDYLMNLFSDRVSLNQMTDTQKTRAYEHFFGHKLPKGIKAASLPDLVVGDFATVKNSLGRMAPNQSDETLVEMLQKQSKDRAQTWLTDKPRAPDSRYTL